MKIYGIDFTSRPGRQKAITCLRCELDNETLVVKQLTEWTDFRGFESLLEEAGPWVAGMDFPFGLSRRFVENIGWPLTWEGYVTQVGQLDRQAFRDCLNEYKAGRPIGDKEHRRQTDQQFGAISPQKLVGVPIALMFYEGARRLRQSTVSIPKLKAGNPETIAVEAYPGTLARRLIGRRTYKSDNKSKQNPEQRKARTDLLRLLNQGATQDSHQVTVEAPLSLADDPKGDALDALLCAVQAAWAYRNRTSGYGAPADMDTLEGWIAEPDDSSATDSEPFITS